MFLLFCFALSRPPRRRRLGTVADGEVRQSDDLFCLGSSQITLLSDRKEELERRIANLVDERENMSLSLEESGDKILLLEKQRHEYEAQVLHAPNTTAKGTFCVFSCFR